MVGSTPLNFQNSFGLAIGSPLIVVGTAGTSRFSCWMASASCCSFSFSSTITLEPAGRFTFDRVRPRSSKWTVPVVVLMHP